MSERPTRVEIFEAMACLDCKVDIEPKTITIHPCDKHALGLPVPWVRNPCKAKLLGPNDSRFTD